MLKPRRTFHPRRALPLAVLIVASSVFPGAGADKTEPQGNVPVLVKSRGPLTPETAAAIGSLGTRVTFVWPEIDAMAMTVNAARLHALAADPRVALVEPDRQGSAPGIGGDGAGGAAPELVAVPLPQAATPIIPWNLDMADVVGTGYDGSGVTVAVVDSGLPQNWQEFLPPGSVDTRHAAGFGAEGWGDFHSQVQAIRGVGGHIGLFPHGLAVSSLIAGFPSEAGPIGGAAPGATILPVRVLNQFNFGWFSWFAAGILHVGRLKAEGALPGPVVINFSIQAGSNSAILADAIDYATSQGVLFVTIAGNFGPDAGTVSFPGRRPQSITAGAVGWLREFCEPFCPGPWFFGNVPENDPTQIYVAGFSGRESDPPPGPSAIDVLAPGSFVFGEWLFGPGFSEGREIGFDAVDNFIFGTSFAAPHVAGIVAQMLEKNPGLTQAQAEGILRGSALPVPPSGDLSTPVQFIPGWGANATGAGLARGAAAVAATPAP
jgi:subtilisin family serine protease